MNPAIPPRPDIPYMGGGGGGGTQPPPTPERTSSSAGSTTSKTPVRREPPPIPPHPDPEWKEHDEMRARELEEARTRTAQMEKTMRWWSDCTSNWREKWSKVRNERNKARDECRQLRARLEAGAKETAALRRGKQDHEAELDTLRKRLESYQSSTAVDNHKVTTSSSEPAAPPSVCSSAESHKSLSSEQGGGGTSGGGGGGGGGGGTSGSVAAQNSSREASKDRDSSGSNMPTLQDEFVNKLLLRREKDLESSSSSHSEKSERRKHGGPKHRGSGETSPADDVVTLQRMSALKLKLQEAEKTLQVEREEKADITRSLETMQSELAATTTQHEELKKSQEHAVKELCEVKQEHASQMGKMSGQMEESLSNDSLEQQLADLRKELERLQVENASEWGKRERLETEKLLLERENKKMKQEVESLEEELEHKGHLAAAMITSDIKTMQLDLAEKTKDLGDLRHTHNKLKKHLQEKTAELDHAKSRADQYEVEVKKLRGRIDELKHDLANSEDEADQQAHQVRKLQRTNDELQQQVENLSVQVQHLHTRLRSVPLRTTRTGSLKSFENNDSPADVLSDEEDLED